MGPFTLRVAGAITLTLAAWAALGVELAPGLPHPAPDLVLCVAALWSVRRPSATPLALVFAIGLAQDLVSGAPAGLGAMALLLACVTLQARAPALRRRGFMVEWAVVALIVAAALLGQRLLLGLTLAPAPALGELAARFAATAAAYPLVALLLRWALRIGPAPAAVEGDLMFERRA
jgi:rod shape-determining protein MreD